MDAAKVGTRWAAWLLMVILVGFGLETVLPGWGRVVLGFAAGAIVGGHNPLTTERIRIKLMAELEAAADKVLAKLRGE